MQAFDPATGAATSTYDAFDQILTRTDALGQLTTWRYDLAARSSTLTTPEGLTVKTVHTRRGQTRSITDGLGNTTSYQYDGEGRLLSTSTPLSFQSQRYDTTGNLVESTDAAGSTVAYRYDPAHRLLERVVDPQGLALTTRYTYNGRGEVLTTTDPDGTVTATGHDLAGHTVSETRDPGGLALTTRYQSDPLGQVLSVTDARGSVTRYTYDHQGRRVSMVVDAEGLALTTRYDYDDSGNLAVTDPAGGRSLTVYDAGGHLAYTVSAEGRVEQHVYDAAGREVRTIHYLEALSPQSLAGPVTSEALQRLLADRQDTAQQTSDHRVYDHDNRLRYRIDAAGGVTELRYDANGQVVQQTRYATRIDLAQWTPGTPPAVQPDPGQDQTTRTVHDELGRAIYTLSSAGDGSLASVVGRSYDQTGRVIASTAYAGFIPSSTQATATGVAAAIATLRQPGVDAASRNIYDAAGRLAWTVDGLGGVTQYRYDANGNVLNQREYAQPLGDGQSPTEVRPSAADRLTLHAYDAANRLVVTVDAAGDVTRNTYDNNGNLSSQRVYAQAASAPLARPDATALELAAEVDPSAADRLTHFAYDADNRRIYTVDAEGAVIRTEYLDGGRTQRITAYANRLDPMALPDAVSAPQIQSLLHPDAAQDRSTSRRYDADGLLTEERDGENGLTTHRYDTLGRLTQLSTGSTDGTQRHDQIFVYDAAGYVIEERQSGQESQYHDRNALGQTTRDHSEHSATTDYRHDAAGQLIVSEAHDSANTAIRTRISYDALGRVLTRTEAADSAQSRTTGYRYDALGHQVQTLFPTITGDTTIEVVLEDGSPGRIQGASSTVAYNRFGEAITNTDTAGNVSAKAYDSLGRVRFDIDALGYVSAYSYDTFGNVAGLTRYANGIGIGDGRRDATAVSAALQHSGADRTITTQYDRNGRAVQTTQPQAWASTGLPGVIGSLQSAVTRTSYNAFGEAVLTSALLDGPSQRWATTRAFFDHAARQTASIDAMGYATATAYDSFGNVVRVTEYASFGASQDAQGRFLPPVSSVDDRSTVFTYDVAHHLIGQTRLAAQIHEDGSRSDLATRYTYDLLGRQTSVADPLDQVTFTYYDAFGYIRATAGPATVVNGRAFIPLTEYTRDSLGQVIRQIEYAAGAEQADLQGYQRHAPATGADPAYFAFPQTANTFGSSFDGSIVDHETHYTYDRLGHLTDLTTPDGQHQYRAYDTRGQLILQWQNDAGLLRYTEYRYDALGRQTAVITPSSASTIGGAPGRQLTGLLWNAFGELTARGTWAEGSAASFSEFFQYDNAGHLWRSNAGDGQTTVMLYDLLGRQTAQITSAGSLDLLRSFGDAGSVDAQGHNGLRRTDFELDALGRALVQREAARANPQHTETYRPTTFRTFDRWGNTLSQSDPRDARILTRFAYNAANQLVRQVQPDADGNISAASPLTILVYDALGRQVALNDANGHISRQVWDATNHLLAEVHADGGVVQHSYDAFGDETRTQDAENFVTLSDYDRMGRLTYREHVGDGRFQVVVDGAGAPQLQQTGNSSWQLFAYDAAGHRTLQVDGEGALTQYRYDARGNLAATIDADGFTTRNAYDLHDRLAATQDPNGAIATWAYDDFGQLQSHTDIGGAGYWFLYDSARELIAQGSSRGESIAYTYDAAGQLVRIDDAGTDRHTYYEYDSAGRHTYEQVMQGGGGYQGQALAYDSLGRLSRVSSFDGVNIAMAYDAVGNKIFQSTGYPGGGQAAWFAYDAMNRQILSDGAVDGNAQNLANITVNRGHILAYDHNGNRIQDTSWGQRVVAQYAQHVDESGTPVGPVGFTGYQAYAGPVTHYYGYDSANRLSGVAVEAYADVFTTLDESGRAISVSGIEPIPLGRSQAVFIDRRYYDNAGRLAQSGPGGTVPAAYLAALAIANPGTVGTSTLQNRYDPAGRLEWQRTVDETRPIPDAARTRDTWFVHAVDITEQVLTGHDESGVPTYQTVTRTDSSTGYDPAGNLIYSRSVQVIPDEGTIVTDTVTGLERAEGYRQAFQHTFSRNANSGNHQEARVSQYYDADGFLSSITDSSSAQGNRQIYTDANGVVLLNVQNGTYLRQLVVNGEVLGVYGAGVDPHNPSAGNGNLNFVSQADFNLGYKPVTASYPETSTGQYTVRGGDTLRSIAQSAYGDADLWYQIALANGLEGDSDLRIGASLTIPTQIAGTHNSAGTFSPYDPSRVVGSTSPVNLPIPLGNHPSGGGGCGGVGKIITVVVAVVATYITVGATAEYLAFTLETGFAATAAASAAIAAAAGSIASQVVGNLTGVQDGFSWQAVALSAISAGVGQSVAELIPAAGGPITTAMARQAAASMLIQGAAVALGAQKSFSWTQVAASAAGAGVGAGLNSAMSNNPMTDFDWVNRSLSATAASATTAVMHGGRVSITQVAVDAFGNVLANGLAEVNTQSSKSIARGDSLSALLVLNDNFSGEDTTGNFSVVNDRFSGLKSGITHDVIDSPNVTGSEAFDFMYDSRNGSDIASDNYNGSRRTAFVGMGQGPLAALAEIGLDQAQRLAAYGYLLSTGQVQLSHKGVSMVQPGQELHIDLDNANETNLAMAAIVQENTARAARSTIFDFEPVSYSNSQFPSLNNFNNIDPLLSTGHSVHAGVTQNSNDKTESQSIHQKLMEERYGWIFDGGSFYVPDRLSLNAAATHFMQGNGELVKVRGDTVNLNYIEPEKIDAVLQAQINTRGKPQTSLTASWGGGMRGAALEDRYVYGSVTANPDGKGGLLLRDNYDFESHSQSGEFLRNVATAGGDMMNRFIGGKFGNGSPLNFFTRGTPFKIEFIGSTPKPGK
ncbi:LysM peptidoglycan-binding domain-containing protein [Xylophilus rhododendri]|uniref:LysM peptidoglycan-binding domain-containing protein n=1 Tax=Xylophilus rhododendri TaxID=2697032 RepID=A0A857J5N9_9BURK|nr:LysM peptidoglycan-binding domain-containing protein [Xylophilus rhododendri]